MTPKQAYEIYNTTERTACEAYRQYWVDKFNVVGFSFIPGPWYGRAEDEKNGYKLELDVAPARFQGAKLRITCQPTPAHNYVHWFSVKVKSDNGFYKIVNRINQKDFQ